MIKPIILILLALTAVAGATVRANATSPTISVSPTTVNQGDYITVTVGGCTPNGGIRVFLQLDASTAALFDLTADGSGSLSTQIQVGSNVQVGTRGIYVTDKTSNLSSSVKYIQVNAPSTTYYVCTYANPNSIGATFTIGGVGTYGDGQRAVVKADGTAYAISPANVPSGYAFQSWSISRSVTVTSPASSSTTVTFGTSGWDGNCVGNLALNLAPVGPPPVGGQLVTIVVTNTNGQWISGVDVTLGSLGTKQTTGDPASVVFNNAPAGTYTVTAHKSGYSDASTSVTVSTAPVYTTVTLTTGPSGTPTITISPTAVTRGSSLTFTGSGFTPSGSVNTCIAGVCVNPGSSSTSGTFSFTMLVGTNVPTGSQQAWAWDASTNKNSNSVAITVNPSGGNSQLTVSAGSGGSVSGTASGQYASGTAISITATAASSSTPFSNWEITGASCSGGTSSNPCAFSMPSGPVTVKAIFGGGGTCASGFPVKIYGDAKSEWWIDDASTCNIYLQHKSEVDLFFTYPGNIRDWLAGNLGQMDNFPLSGKGGQPLPVKLTPPGGMIYGDNGVIGIPVDAFYGDYQGVHAGWAYVLIAHEMMNVYTGQAVSGGWPDDWWADHKSPFPLTTGMKACIDVHFQQSATACQGHLNSNMANDPLVAMFYSLYSGYGNGMFGQAFAAAKSDGINWNNIGGNPSALRTGYVTAYLTIGAGGDLTSVFTGKVPNFNPKVTNDIKQARINLQSIPKTDSRWTDYLRGNYASALNSDGNAQSVSVYSVDNSVLSQDPSTRQDLGATIRITYTSGGAAKDQTLKTPFTAQTDRNTQFTVYYGTIPSGYSPFTAGLWDDFGNSGAATGLSATYNVGTVNHKVAAYFSLTETQPPGPYTFGFWNTKAITYRIVGCDADKTVKIKAAIQEWTIWVSGITMTEVVSGEKLTLECLATETGNPPYNTSGDDVRAYPDPDYPGFDGMFPAIKYAYVGIGQCCFRTNYDATGGTNMAAHCIGHAFLLKDNQPTSNGCGWGIMGYCWIGNPVIGAQLQAPTAGELAEVRNNFNRISSAPLVTATFAYKSAGQPDWTPVQQGASIKIVSPVQFQVQVTQGTVSGIRVSVDGSPYMMTAAGANVYVATVTLSSSISHTVNFEYLGTSGTWGLLSVAGSAQPVSGVISFEDPVSPQGSWWGLLPYLGVIIPIFVAILIIWWWRRR